MATKNLSEYNLEEITNSDSFRFGIVVSEWNSHITENLLKGALETFEEFGVNSENIKTYKVPGSFELIYATHKLCQEGFYNAVISIGSVIRGETAHFDFVCQGVTQGLKDINIQTPTPAIFCVLTDDTEQQSIDRSGGKLGNKGVEAAVSAIKMACFRKENC